MGMLRKSLTLTAMAGALLSGALVTPAAAADPNTCPQGYACGWTGKNRTGERRVNSLTPGCYPLERVNRSVSNQTSYRVELWNVTTGCNTGTKLATLKPGTYADNPGKVTGIAVYRI
ncbi:peptidase inhibitor family I36 protein [Streptomyces yerevanensis]|uniref:peptidase inhibitor family I36 protein n=1 Tax=Streptomyces yerevanensis TaxID=66378 RepID=UPI000D13D17C|nr:peptidase inhibitor family I36 protein [Streptomyces yerevanensis]